jgi:hypothetical protein
MIFQYHIARITPSAAVYGSGNGSGGFGKYQPGQKGKQEVWVARVMQGRYQNSSRGSRRQRGRIRKIRPNNWWIRKRCWRVQH